MTPSYIATILRRPKRPCFLQYKLKGGRKNNLDTTHKFDKVIKTWLQPTELLPLLRNNRINQVSGRIPTR